MSVDRLKFILILTPLILCILLCKSYPQTIEPSISTYICPINLLTHDEVFFDLLKSVEQSDTDKLLALKNISFDIYTDYQIGQTLLYYAAFLGKAEIIDALVFKLEVNINTKDENGWTALHHAVLNPDMPSRIDTIYALIQLGADIETLDLNNIENELSWYKNIKREKISPSRYSQAEKEKAIKLALDIDTLQAAKLLQIKYGTLQDWVYQHRKAHNMIEYKPHSQKQKIRAIGMVIERGIMQSEVIKKLNVSESTLSGWINEYRREHNIPIPGRYSQDQKNKAIKMVIEKGITVKQVAEKLNMSESVIFRSLAQYRKKHNIQASQPHSQEVRDQAIEMVMKKNMEVSQVAEIIGVPKTTVSHWISRHKEKHNISKAQPYSQELKDQVIKMVVKDKVTEKQVAKILKVSIGFISKLVNQYRREHNIPIRKTYSRELKNEAVRMVIEDGISNAQVAKDLEISESSLSAWVVLFKRKHNIKVRTAYSPELKDQAMKMVIEDNIDEMQVAKDLKVSRRTVSRWVYRHRKKHNILVYKVSYSQEQRNEAIEMIVKNKMTMKKVAEKLNVTRFTIYDWVHQYEKEHDYLIIRNRHYSQEIVDETVEMVIEDRMPVAQVAKDFDISESTLFRWIRKHKKKNKVESKEDSRDIGLSNKSIEITKVNGSSKYHIEKTEDSLTNIYLNEIHSRAAKDILRGDLSIEDILEDPSIDRDLLNLKIRENQYNSK